MDETEFTDEVSERERLIENLILDRSTHLWVADDFVPRIRNVLDRLPLANLKQLDEKDFKFLASEGFKGRAFRLSHNCSVGDLVVFLSPELLALPPESSEAVIAHELAHVLLDHEEIWLPNAHDEAERDEREADDLIRSWGFEPPPLLFDRYD